MDPCIFWFSANPTWYKIILSCGRQRLWVFLSIASSLAKLEALVTAWSLWNLVSVVTITYRTSIDSRKWLHMCHRKNHYRFGTMPMSFLLTIAVPKIFKITQVNVAFLVTYVPNGILAVLQSPAVKARQTVALKWTGSTPLENIFQPFWNIDIVSDVILLRSINDTPAINSFMYCIGGVFTFFPYHT